MDKKLKFDGLEFEVTAGPMIYLHPDGCQLITMEEAYKIMMANSKGNGIYEVIK